ncbi:MAG: hypothetical protein HYZ85_02055 [Candidatus Omnitrophica bacterium]|nr:hypothetical protein [Candidatus Omnitrophota bacterium]
MKTQFGFFILAVLLTLPSISGFSMSRQGQYDEEARQAEREEKWRRDAEKKGAINPAKEIVGGVKQATVDSTAGFLSETAESTREEAPVVGTLEGARQGTEKLLDNTVKGAVKVATLGYGNAENYEIEEPEKGSGEPTKIKIKIPGT